MSSNPPSIAAAAATLLDLPLKAQALVLGVVDAQPNDRVAQRLRELGFVPGEPVRLLAKGPWGAEPLLVQVGFTRFALRRLEAGRVRIEPLATAAMENPS